MGAFVFLQYKSLAETEVRRNSVPATKLKKQLS